MQESVETNVFLKQCKDYFSYIELLMWIIIGVDENKIMKRFMRWNYAFLFNLKMVLCLQKCNEMVVIKLYMVKKTKIFLMS